MGFPVITRLGTHQFWFNHWVNDFSYSTYFKQNKSIKLFTSLYLKYGVLYRNDIFVNRYWFTKTSRQLSTQLRLKKKKLHTRKKLFENTRFNVVVYYDERLQVSEYFPMKTWVVKFNNWLLILLHWFKPFKGKSHQRKNNFKFSTFNIKFANNIRTTTNLSTLAKSKLLNSLKSSRFYYF